MLTKLVLVSALVVFVAGALVVGLLLGSSQAKAQVHPLVGPFVDVQGHWAAGEIEAIRLAGLTSGCSTNPPMFCPDRPLTRAEAAVLFARLLGQ